ncbi:phospholipid carrier-dependent glycosyltransferase [Jatrophihabitans telluris]|uniref:Phospholipid carrier-dependent glycosyltransferase n=1 Tax=Jatrophihabitans telluris TaxID=2038343 RepID=A0ABY4R0G1_9ACTN|nr:phospholipid carrier-dependent glycosyltransferase [Jatrophihabitans telluris]UQX89329.1 phospholipid carrier-dependent glycosyltransferase [Jatrophihabitans telluris]
MPIATLLPEDPGDSAVATPPPPLRARPLALTPWRPDRALNSWLWTLAVTAIAAGTRFWALGFPAGKSFDEVYYATEAQEMLRYGYEDNRGYMFVVHPPLGKWLIGLTSAIWGNNSFGWRIAPAVAGVISVIVLTRVAMRMLRSVLLGTFAGLLLSLDGISLVMSRVALLDIFLQTFVIAGFAFLVLDRDQLRSRLGALYEAGLDLGRGVPALGPRPYRLAGGIMLGLAFGIKWSALSFWLGFALLSLLWDRGALKAAGVELPTMATLKRSVPYAFFSLGLAPAVAYVLTWLGWFVGDNSWNRHWGDTHPGTGLFALLPSGLRSLLDYHHQAYLFHSNLSSYHAYKANPWSWLVLGRPILFYYPTQPAGCGAVKADGTPDCARAILLIGTPLMYWAILPALGWLAWLWFTRRDWRAGAIAMAFLAGWGVWLHDQKRTGFLFYMTPLMPFLMIALAMAVGALLSPAAEDGTSVLNRWRSNTGKAIVPRHGLDEPVPELPETIASQTTPRVVGLREWVALREIPLTRMLRSAVVAVWLGAVVADFVWMWPIFTGGLLTYEQWNARMWFPGWI